MMKMYYWNVKYNASRIFVFLTKCSSVNDDKLTMKVKCQFKYVKSNKIKEKNRSSSINLAMHTKINIPTFI